VESLKYLSEETIDSLRENVANNIERYRAGDFSDLRLEGEWDVPLKLSVDLSPLASLSTTVNPETEANNSLLVWTALSELPPALAFEEGIWARLTHVECLSFSRARWLSPTADDDATKNKVLTHFFASSLRRRRDDNSISRLWWNAYIANQIAPNDMNSALSFLLRSADIRSNVIQRSRTGMRTPLITGIVRSIRMDPWVTQHEDNFREFMKAVNKGGGGILFEAMPESEIDAFVSACTGTAKSRIEQMRVVP
jgi:hypothetical protein